jgi:hypothetical protein
MWVSLRHRLLRALFRCVFAEPVSACRRCRRTEAEHATDDEEWRDAGAPEVCQGYLPGGWRYPW